jgi:hypothetical protein
MFCEREMSVHPTTGAASSMIRRLLRPALVWRSHEDSPYSAAFSIVLLLAVGVAVKLGH